MRNIFLQLLACILTYIIVISHLDWVYFLYVHGSKISTYLSPATGIGAIVPFFGIPLLYYYAKVRKDAKLLATAWTLAQVALLIDQDANTVTVNFTQLVKSDTVDDQAPAWKKVDPTDFTMILDGCTARELLQHEADGNLDRHEITSTVTGVTITLYTKDDANLMDLSTVASMATADGSTIDDKDSGDGLIVTSRICASAPFPINWESGPLFLLEQSCVKTIFDY